MSWIPRYHPNFLAMSDLSVKVLDEQGELAAGWMEAGRRHDTGSLIGGIPPLVSLDRSSFLLLSKRIQADQTIELRVISGRIDQDGPPGPQDLSDTVVSKSASDLGIADAIPCDTTAAFLALYEGSGLRVRKIGATSLDAPGWPVGGVGLGSHRQLGGIATDDSGGVYVADCASASCNWAVDDCTTTVVVRRILADGTFDPRWPGNGRTLATGVVRGASEIIVPDGAGGCFALWSSRTTSGLRSLRLIRLKRDGSFAPGWAEAGVSAFTGFSYRPGRDDYNRGPQTVVSDSSDLILPALVTLDEVLGSRQIVLLARSGTGGLPSAWSSDSIPLSSPSGVIMSSPHIARDSAGRAVIVWAKDWRIYARTIDTRTGQSLPGWPDTGRVLCPSSELRDEPDLLVHEDGTFTVSWTEEREDEFGARHLGVRHGRFHIEDGTVATALAARLIEHRVHDGWLEAEWSLSNSGGASIELQRAVDDAAFLEHEGLERVGSIAIRLRDPVPAGAQRLRYVLRVGSDAISDTLNVALGAAQAPRLVAATLQRGSHVELRLRLDTPQEWVEVALHDIAGRQVAKRRWDALAVGEHDIGLEPRAARPGVLLARMRTADGASVVRTIVRLTE